MCSVFILVTSSTCSILCCLLGFFSPSFLKRSYLLNARSVPWRNWEATLGFFPTEMSRRVPGLSWSISQPLRLHREPPASSPASLWSLEGIERQPAPTTQLQVKASAGTLQRKPRRDVQGCWICALQLAFCWQLSYSICTLASGVWNHSFFTSEPLSIWTHQLHTSLAFSFLLCRYKMRSQHRAGLCRSDL